MLPEEDVAALEVQSVTRPAARADRAWARSASEARQEIGGFPPTSPVHFSLVARDVAFVAVYFVDPAAVVSGVVDPAPPLIA